MRRWKKILSASLVAVMVGSLGMTAFAEDTSANEPIDTTVSNYNLTEGEDKQIYFIHELQLLVVRNKKTGDIVSVVRRRAPKEAWGNV